MAHQGQCINPLCESWNYRPDVSSQPIDKAVLRSMLDPELKPQVGENYSFSIVEIYFPELRFTWTKEIAVYSVDSFISNVGGQLGKKQLYCI